MANNIKDFKINTRVYLSSDHLSKGKVIKNKLKLKDNVAIEWDGGSISTHHINNLVLASLHEEFEKCKRQIKAKLDQAALLIQEAAAMKLSSKINIQDLEAYDLKYAIQDLDIWTSSDMNC